MKNPTAKQIEQIKRIKPWTSTKFHGNRKKVEHLLVSDLKEIVQKKRLRELLNMKNERLTNVEITKDCISWSLQTKGTNYFKTMIEGDTGIYYAHSAYRHSDYNKSRLFDKTPETLKLMNLFISYINKKIQS